MDPRYSNLIIFISSLKLKYGLHLNVLINSELKRPGIYKFLLYNREANF